MNQRNSSRLGELLRQFVQAGADLIRDLAGSRLRRPRYGDAAPDIIIDMPQPPTVYEDKPGTKVVGYLMAIGGFLGGSANLALTTVIVLGAWLADELALGLGASIFPLILTGGCGFLLHRGLSMVGSYNRFRTYRRVIGDEELCNIRHLADQVGRNDRFVVKDVEKMIRKGWFRQGHLDQKKTCLMVTDHMYQEYRKIEREREQHRIEEQEERRRRQEEERRKAENNMKPWKTMGDLGGNGKRKGALWNTSKMDGSIGNEDQGRGAYGRPGGGDSAGGRESGGTNPGRGGDTIESFRKKKGREHLPEDVRRVLEQGDEYVAKIRACNDAIPGEEVSAKIDRMEDLVDRIFDRIEQKPEFVGDIRRLMEYYLPTTVKLLNTYAEMDAQPVGGENIRMAKQEIEASLDTINHAFEKLLDSLFQDDAWDISTDISVMKTMMAQEGLHKEDFK